MVEAAANPSRRRGSSRDMMGLGRTSLTEDSRPAVRRLSHAGSAFVSLLTTKTKGELCLIEQQDRRTRLFSTAVARGLSLKSVSEDNEIAPRSTADAARDSKQLADEARVASGVITNAAVQLAAVLLCVTWLVSLAVMRQHAPPSFPLLDPTISALSIALAYMGVDGTLSESLLFGRFYALVGVPVSRIVSFLLLHAAAACYALLQLLTTVGAVEAARVGVLYVILVTIFVQSSFIFRNRTRVMAYAAQNRELALRHASMQSMLETIATRVPTNDGEDSNSDSEGDEREHLIVPPPVLRVADDVLGLPHLAIQRSLDAQNKFNFNKSLAIRIASRLRKPTYSLARFYDDVRQCFPELDLYLAIYIPDEEVDDDRLLQQAHKTGAVTSGLSSDDEYRRTIGAIFAIYWLMRIGIDGERGFSFGVDDEWKPKERPEPGDPAGDAVSHVGQKVDEAARALSAEDEKRRAFHDKQDWGRLQQLLVDAGMLKQGEDNSVTVDVERTMAMLALTAFHDIMKCEALLPRVAPEHAPYMDFKAGDLINDHDIALGYLLTFHADVLPSFSAMSKSDQQSIRFTQSKMSFNHGWLGEAPPAPLFARFKEVMTSEKVAPSDVAFYFVHWLTDLAGAEPSPLGGAEKFVLKFPHAVLDSFIRSFSVIDGLAVKTETAVMEEYLVQTWTERPGAGLAPQGEDAIALMRLMLQAQVPDKQQALLAAWENLSNHNKSILVDEMSRSGIVNQIFTRGPAFKQAFGPAFLVYYSPAFLRNLAPKQTHEALSILAEIYRCARELWPLRPTTGNDHSVTIRIDQLKELKVDKIVEQFAAGNTWLLVRKNDREGIVECHSIEVMQELVLRGVQSTLLKLWRCSRQMNAAYGKECVKLSKHLGKKHSRILTNNQGVDCSGRSDSSSKTGTNKTHNSGSRGNSANSQSTSFERQVGDKVGDKAGTEPQKMIRWSITRDLLGGGGNPLEA